MSSAHLGSVLRHLRSAAGASSTAGDRELLQCFCARRDEAAFAQLLRRHGPMVIGVGRRVLRQEEAEDVFQATVLLLARKAPSLCARESVGGWLHGVAYHLALKARAREGRRRAHERRAAAMRKTATAEAAWQELREVLDQALPLLQEQLAKAWSVDDRQVARWLTDLDSDEFAVREKAVKELEKLGEVAEPALRKALSGEPSAEVRRQAERLLERLQGVAALQMLRGLRSVEVLEGIGTDEARRLLEKLAEEVPSPRLVREAKSALDRLDKRPRLP
jgi:DNA-directed RNA polymerase specialized sigma24 family protein